MINKNSITQETLRSILDYNPETGIFIWKAKDESLPCYHNSIRGWNKKYAGHEAGNIMNTGYRAIVIDYEDYLAHRLAWLYVYGYFPKECIDHIDLDRGNNKIINLREATRRNNNCNMGISKKNTSGFKGVYWNVAAKKWQAYISVNNKSKYLGVYKNKEDAYKAFCDAAKKYHGEFARVA